MGIPRYFRFIVENCKNQLLLNPEQVGRCDRLFFDFNCIVHASAASITTTKGYDPSQHDDIQTLFRNVIKSSIEYLESIIRLLAPTQHVFIALDGPCPFAKIVQQRKRRFISAWRKRNNTFRKTSLFSDKDWDSNCVTPGTEFMDFLNHALHEFVSDFNRAHDATMMLLSDSTAFGEGEHKIFRYLRHHPPSSSSPTSPPHMDIVYGLDADLILLSLCGLDHTDPARYNIGLLREVPEFNLEKTHGFVATSPFLVMDMQKFKTTIVNQHGPNIVPAKLDVDAFLRDYIILCTFFGNDFLPTLSYLRVGNHSVSRLMQAYETCLENAEKGTTLVQRDFQINLTFLKQYLAYLAKDEDAQWQHMFALYAKKKPYMPPHIGHKSMFQKKEYELDHHPIFCRPQNDTALLDPTQKGWRMSYYHHFFGASSSNAHRACHEYICGLQFVSDYYWKQNASLDWHYPYPYAPTLLDLSNYLAFHEDACVELNTRHNQKYVDMLLHNKYLQLLCVLPPQSMYLLPDTNARRFMTDVGLGCAHFYPQQFRLTMFLKDFLWECHPIIPMINIYYLFHQMCDASREEASRNESHVLA